MVKKNTGMYSVRESPRTQGKQGRASLSMDIATIPHGAYMHPFVRSMVGICMLGRHPRGNNSDVGTAGEILKHMEVEVRGRMLRAVVEMLL